MNLVKLQDTKLIYRNLLHFSNNEPLQREMKKAIPFTTASKRIKHLRINLPKEVKDLHSENCKIPMKETEDDTDGKYIMLMD